MYRPPPLNKCTDTCKNITFPQISFLACRNTICKIFPDDNIDNVPPGQFPLEGEMSKTNSESGQTTEGTNSSEHDNDDNAESVDKATQELACPIHNQDKLPDKTSEQQPYQPLDLKKSNSFLN